MALMEQLFKIYSKFPLKKSFEDYIAEMVEDFGDKIFEDVIHSIVVKEAKEKYPQYPCKIRPMADGGKVLTFYNVPFEEAWKIKDCFRRMIEELDAENRLDLLVETKNTETTKEHYQHVLDEINKQG